MVWASALHLMVRSVHGVSGSTFTTNAAISACARSQAWASVVQIVSTKVAMDTGSYISAMSTFSRKALWNWCLGAIEFMQVTSLQHDVLGFSLAAHACGNCGKWKAAVDLFFAMWRQRI